MIVFPNTGWNTFIDVADADARFTELGLSDMWEATTKEEMLAKSALLIQSTCYVSEGGCDYATAQILLIQSDILNNGKYLSFVETTQQYTEAKIGSLQVKYNLNTASELPSVVKSILGGCLRSGATVRGFTIA